MVAPAGDCNIVRTPRRSSPLIGDPTYADAIFDRHNAHRINLTGHNLRRSRATKPSKD
jgi:hypothetical protein